MTTYLFDVDGTLTPGRGVIDPAFGDWFLEFSGKHTVSLVTGSDIAKTQEQVGAEIMSAIDTSFNCSGNAIYRRGELVYESDWQCPTDLWRFLEDRLRTSEYRHRCGQHFEPRTGMLNFSVVGRNAQGYDRQHYYLWDHSHGERALIAEAINRGWPDVQAVIGGEISIDIFRRGTDKSQVLRWITDDIVFVGDRMEPGGNDWPLAEAIASQGRGQSHAVSDWRHTWQLLQSIDHV
jgi:hydroxymethylpyrimidine pyrophosphatase-like HAD family hydrolase